MKQLDFGVAVYCLYNPVFLMKDPMSSTYSPNDTEEIIARLKKAINIDKVDELFADLPKEILLTERLNLPASLSEMEAKRQIEEILSKNSTFKEMSSFLGAGLCLIMCLL
jgi:glycine cleavage system pyridoxal-binding protein P